MDVQHVWPYEHKTTVKAGSEGGIYCTGSVETSFISPRFLARLETR